jgi:hypothetical protein
MGLLIGHVVEVTFEAVEPIPPRPPVGREPIVDLPEGLGPEAVEAALGIGPDLHQPGIEKHPEMLGHPRLADAQVGHEGADRALLFPKEVQDAATIGVGQDREHGPIMI